MPLSIIPKKEPKPVAVSMRLSKTAAEYLKKLAEAHNMSQADVIETLLKQEFELFNKGRWKAAEKKMTEIEKIEELQISLKLNEWILDSLKEILQEHKILYKQKLMQKLQVLEKKHPMGHHGHPTTEIKAAQKLRPYWQKYLLQEEK